MSNTEFLDARPLIPSKISIPHIDSSALHRPRLEALLDEAANKPLCIIRAPAGFGKTTLMSHWCLNQPGRVAWLHIDELDNDPSFFGRYLLSALQQQIPELKEAFERIAEVLHLYDLIWLAGKLCNELSTLDQRIVLVLDDYHHIRHERIHEALRFLIQHQPAPLHLYILTRGEPPLGLANWRVRGILQEIGADELSFNLEEAQQFLSEKSLSETDIHLLDEVLDRLNGWAAGLQIIALSTPTQESISNFLKHFNGTHAHVLDFLAEEILNKQPEVLQQFLLKTSIVDRFNPELAEAITGCADSFSLLQDLEKRGLFVVPLDEYRRWYRYHPFFAEFLRHQLKQETASEQLIDLHQRAHDWWLGQNQVQEALSHALVVQNLGLIEQTLTEYGWTLFEQGQMTLIENCLSALPDSVIENNYKLALLQAWICLTQADPDSLKDALKQAEQQLPDYVEDEKWRWISAEIYALKASLSAIAEDIDAAQSHANQALKLAPPGGSNAATIALTVQGEVQVCRGELPKAFATFQEAEQAARNIRSIQLMLWTLGQQSDTLFHQGYLVDAYQKQTETFQVAREHHLAQIPVMEFVHRCRATLLLEWLQFHEARQHCDYGNKIIEHLDSHCAIPINALRAQIAVYQDDMESAAGFLEKNHRLIKDHHCHTDWYALSMNIQLKFWMLQRDTAAIRTWLSQQEVADVAINHFHQCLNRTIAFAMLASNFPQPALDVLEPLVKQARSHHLGLSELKGQLLCTWAYSECNQHGQALNAARRALELAEPMRAIASFLVIPEKILGVFNDVLEKNELPATERRHIQRILELSKRQQRPQKKSDDMPEQAKALALTPKEWEVLRLIGEGCSNEGIAQRLFVAPSTVRSHIKHVYQKLGIGSRADARRVSKDLAQGRMTGILN